MFRVTAEGRHTSYGPHYITTETTSRIGVPVALVRVTDYHSHGLWATFDAGGGYAVIDIADRLDIRDGRVDHMRAAALSAADEIAQYGQ